MKAVILAGGAGTRLAEETQTKPKPMVEIGGMPILWHIMKIYSAHGINEFVICLGYKGHMIKEWFANQWIHRSDISCDLESGEVKKLDGRLGEKWKVTLADTGEKSYTATRLRIASKYLDLASGEPFCMTYGDGVGDVDITKLVAFHKKEKRQATVTVAQPPARFGAVELVGNQAVKFIEKPEGEGGWVNAGFFVLNPEALNWIGQENCMWEEAPLRACAAAGELSAFKHHGFWHPMDALRDKMRLEGLWADGSAPWKVWKEEG